MDTMDIMDIMDFKDIVGMWRGLEFWKKLREILLDFI
jgi:hypothetical protein